MRLEKLFIFARIPVTKYYSGDQIKNEMGRACSTYGSQKRWTQGFGGNI
jgi:hypothetical protein